MSELSSQKISDLCSLIDDTCANLPCASVVVVGDGHVYAEKLFEHSAGNDEGDGIYWLASCTKLVTAIACMQLVEQGKVGLDDSDHVGRLCPELKTVQVLENGVLVKKQTEITLRMLLTHTGKPFNFNRTST